MEKLIHTNTIEYNNYKTEFFTEEKLHLFLISQAIPCLSSRFKDEKSFYDSFISKIPKAKNIKNLKMIYTGLENNAKIKTEEKNIIAKGHVTIVDTIPDEKGNHPKVNWILKKD